MEWIYPEEGKTWEEGDDIIAEYTIPATRAESTARMKYKIIRCCEFSYYAWEFENGNNLQASDVRIIAYMPYTKPELPGKPQDCPFCGAKMEVYENVYEDWIAICSVDDCLFRTPSCKTKAEAIKVLNSVRVEKCQKT